MTSRGGIPFFDAHVHLADSQFATDVESVCQAAATAGVRALACSGTAPADWADVEALAARDLPLEVIPCFGLHPWSIAEAGPDWLEKLEAVLRRWPDAPVGEIGLDCWKEPVDRAAQQQAFCQQWTLAAKLDRPVIVHCVQAWGWLMEVLETLPPLERFMLHAYSGSTELIAPLAAHGAWFSVAGNVLRESHTRQQETLRHIPRERLLVETDAPDIVPPRRFCRDGKRNEPANVPAILTGIAAFCDESPEELAEQVYQNSLQFFGHTPA